MTVSRSSFAVFSLLVAAGAAYFSVLPQWRTVSSLRTEIRNLQALRDEINELIGIRDRLADDYRKIPPADIGKLSAIVPRGPQPASLVVDLEAVAARSGIALAQVNIASGPAAQPALAAPSSRAVPLPVSFTVVAAYGSIEPFLVRLERSRRIVDITDFSFVPGKGAASVTFQGQAYYRP